jgi:hypothetical protein
MLNVLIKRRKLNAVRYKDLETAAQAGKAHGVSQVKLTSARSLRIRYANVTSNHNTPGHINTRCNSNITLNAVHAVDAICGASLKLNFISRLHARDS